jgi:hypothetical protein
MHDIDRSQQEYGQMESFEFSSETVFNEAQELELAAELLEVSSEEELDHFLGDLIKKAGQAVGSFVNSPTGQAIGGLLKGAAKKVLPAAGQAIGGYFGGSTGANIGGQIGQAASGLFEHEDRELDTAKSFVRMAGDAVKNATTAPQGSNPRAVATAAVTQAAQAHLPALVAGATPQAGGPGSGAQNGHRSHTGRWIRRGSKIVLLGV